MPRNASRQPRRSKGKSRAAADPAPAGAERVVVPEIDDEVVEGELHPLPAEDAAPDSVLEHDPETSADPESAEPADSGALVKVDALSRYLAEIRRFPLLSREEELEVAKRYREHHDRDDAYRLVTANLRLVVKIALEFARATRNVLDLIQEGNVGLMEAVRNFDPYRGVRFPSYAVWWVRAYIYRYLINNWRLVKVGTTQAQRKLFFNLRKETERLERMGFTPTPKLLASRMGVKETEVREMQERMAQSEVSLDQPAGENQDTQLSDVLPDTEENPEELTAGAEWRTFARDQVQRFAATLKDKELEIFNSRLLAEEPLTLQEIGERQGISRERVRQIETRLKRRLKEFIKSQAADVEEAGTS
ncbi:MAG TPA: RNA polymerase factor sigma-32 [Candidatus Binataceae bacterium]|nr:RNA polymerase factor sigma-32 [Candidatus Binataceae bacterium]